MSETILFVTGRLAEPALRRTLAEMRPAFAYEVAVLRISVAALMTTAWITKHLVMPAGCDRIIIPGLCQGDLAEIEQRFGVPAQRGPKDVQDLPRFFGRPATRPGYGAYTIEIVAEIQDATTLDEQVLLARAAAYRADGADVIDLGIGPGRHDADVGRAVALLKQAGYRVSIDTLDPQLLRAADAAGADYLLSLDGSNLELARELRAIPVIIPDTEGGPATLWRNVDQVRAWGRPHIVDPIIQPIGFGFARSLHELYRVRERYPDAPIMLGAHHLSELIDADSTGVNALMMGIAQELRAGFVLTTEVAHWAQGSVRELDIARRLMYYAVEHSVLPKNLDDRLLTIRDRRVIRQSEAELRELQAAITDPNFRIFSAGGQVYAFNAEVFAHGTDIQAVFAELGVEDPAHAFYLGCELTRAQLAGQLGKHYRQDEALRWGYLTVEEPPAHERRVKISRRSRSRRPTTDNRQPTAENREPRTENRET